MGRVMSFRSELALPRVALVGLRSSRRRGDGRLRLGLGRRGGSPATAWAAACGWGWAAGAAVGWALGAPEQAQGVVVVVGVTGVVVSLIISVSFLWLPVKWSNLLTSKAFAVPPRRDNT